jgi:anti-anti-sigma factor
VLGIEVKRLNSGGVEVVPRGSLDSESVGELRPVLLDATFPPQRMLLNLSDLEAIDSAGMALVMMARIELEATGTRFVVESSDPAITEVLIGAGLGRFVDIAPRRLDALRALGDLPGSVHDLLADFQSSDGALGDGVAGEPYLLPQKRWFAVRDVAVR